jgi:hypothetical protein
MLSRVPARRHVGPKIDQNSGEVKLKLPEDASEPMRQGLRAMRAGLSASRYPIGFDGMVFAYYFNGKHDCRKCRSSAITF